MSSQGSLSGSLLRCRGPFAADFGALQPQGLRQRLRRRHRPRRQAAELEALLPPPSKRPPARRFALVTLPSLEGEPIEDVANVLYRQWGVGKKGKNEGILLLLAIDERRSRLEVGYGLEPILPDG